MTSSTSFYVLRAESRLLTPSLRRRARVGGVVLQRKGRTRSVDLRLDELRVTRREPGVRAGDVSLSSFALSRSLKAKVARAAAGESSGAPAAATSDSRRWECQPSDHRRASGGSLEEPVFATKSSTEESHALSLRVESSSAAAAAEKTASRASTSSHRTWA